MSIVNDRLNESTKMLLLSLFIYSIISLNAHLVNSAIWIIRQYSSTIQENEAAICSSGNFICSTAGTPTRHITKIDMFTYDTTTTGLLPDPSLIAFDFPEMAEIQIRALQLVKLGSKNILTFINNINMPVISKITITSDASVTLIPEGYTIGLPSLKFLTIQGTYLIQDMVPFNFGPVIEQVRIPVNGYVSFDPSIVHTMLNTLNLQLRLPSTQLALTIPHQSFPVLQTSSTEVVTNYATDHHPFSLTMDAKPFQFYFRDNKLQDIPWNNLVAGQPNILLDVRLNPTLVTTTVPQSFCKNRLFIEGCPNITNVPDCLKCYQKDPLVFRTSIPLDPSFICPISFYNDTILTVGGFGDLFGVNIGYGNLDSTSFLNAIIPNSHLRYYDMLKQSGPARTVSLTLNNNYPEYKYDFTVLEVGIIIQTDSVGLAGQFPNQTCRFISFPNLINPSLAHTIKINHDIDCVISSTVAPFSLLFCNTTGHSFSPGQNVTYTISNAHYTSVDRYMIIPCNYLINTYIYIN
ncbi:hypothetical protein DFA_09557 [Cavenderia fasciculata]|uniref:Uncharacterized protein n=1 Tax=Cavenderia fasciculata TaxID=261658 RepID=F4Q7Y8_CACFS|nr:uncharacterized protein DFA_09557 [Cavenderia fasciculata]EGG15888.1 hypothetical protein DFA_09557 [Cavenderia fasciculata]|eukprot:XP_004352213.1 hypothetical protein DFA_09557 [Cavenderia fasciculata]